MYGAGPLRGTQHGWEDQSGPFIHERTDMDYIFLNIRNQGRVEGLKFLRPVSDMSPQSFFMSFLCIR